MAPLDYGPASGNPGYYPYSATPSPAASPSGSGYGYSARPSPRSFQYTSRESSRYIYPFQSPREESSPTYGASVYYPRSTTSPLAGSPSDGRSYCHNQASSPSRLRHHSRHMSSGDSYEYYPRREYSPRYTSSGHDAAPRTRRVSISKPLSAPFETSKSSYENKLHSPQIPVHWQSSTRREAPLRKPVPRPKATDEDARKHRIPPGYSLKNWDPTEEPITILGSVFDANSLGKWIYDWTVYHRGPSMPIGVAADLWILFIQLDAKVQREEGSGKNQTDMQRILSSMLNNNSTEKRQLVDDFIFQLDIRKQPSPNDKVRRNLVNNPHAQLGAQENEVGTSNTTHLEDHDEAQESGEDEAYLNINSKFLGRANLTNWKRGAGRAKDWRKQCYAKVPTLRQKSTCRRSRKRVGSSCENHIRFHSRHMKFKFQRTATTMPAVAYKRHTHVDSEAEIIRASPSILPRMNRKLLLKYLNTTVFDDMPAVDASRPPKKDRFVLESSLLFGFQRLLPRNVRTQQNNEAEQTIILNYPGEVLPFAYRILHHLRSETHHEVYTGDSIVNDQRYEIKVYTLSGVPANQRKRRVENLKKKTAIPSFVTSFDWNGKKYAIFNPRDDREETGTKRLVLGAIGRRNTKEFDEAFPKLPNGPIDSTALLVMGKGSSDKETYLKQRPRTLIWKSARGTEIQSHKVVTIGCKEQVAASPHPSDLSFLPPVDDVPNQKKSRNRHRKKRTKFGDESIKKFVPAGEEMSS